MLCLNTPNKIINMAKSKEVFLLEKSFCLLFAIRRHIDRKVGGFIQYTTSRECHLFFGSVRITCHCDRFNVLGLVRILIVWLWSFLLNLLTSLFLLLSFYSVFLNLLLEHFIHVLCQLANFRDLFHGNWTAAVFCDVSGNFERPVQDLVKAYFNDSGKVCKILVHPSAKQADRQSVNGLFALILRQEDPEG